MPMINSKSGWLVVELISQAKAHKNTKKKNSNSTVRILLLDICSYIKLGDRG
jgi:hypothetical protein